MKKMIELAKELKKGLVKVEAAGIEANLEWPGEHRYCYCGCCKGGKALSPEVSFTTEEDKLVVSAQIEYWLDQYIYSESRYFYARIEFFPIREDEQGFTEAEFSADEIYYSWNEFSSRGNWGRKQKFYYADVDSREMDVKQDGWHESGPNPLDVEKAEKKVINILKSLNEQIAEILKAARKALE